MKGTLRDAQMHVHAQVCAHTRGDSGVCKWRCTCHSIIPGSTERSTHPCLVSKGGDVYMDGISPATDTQGKITFTSCLQEVMRGLLYFYKLHQLVKYLAISRLLEHCLTDSMLSIIQYCVLWNNHNIDIISYDYLLIWSITLYFSDCSSITNYALWKHAWLVLSMISAFHDIFSHTYFFAGGRTRTTLILTRNPTDLLIWFSGFAISCTASLWVFQRFV